MASAAAPSRVSTHTRHWPGLAFAGAVAAGWLAVHLGAIFGFDLARDWPWALPLVVAQAWLSTALFIVAHDAMHGSLAPGRPGVNRWAARVALGLYAGIDADRMTPAHHDHHAHVGTARDPDFHPDRPDSFAPWLIRFFRGYYTHAQLARITVAACVYLALGAHLINIVVFWAVPALLALLQLFTFGTWLPHRHGRQAFADRHNARSTPMPRALSLLTCLHFGGYHHEHHLHPGVPWWRLPRAR